MGLKFQGSQTVGSLSGFLQHLAVRPFPPVVFFVTFPDEFDREKSPHSADVCPNYDLMVSFDRGSPPKSL